MPNHVEIWDLIKSNPIEDYWVCSVVLTSRKRTDGFAPMCHVAVTNVVLDHSFTESEIDFENLRVIFEYNNEGHKVPCIGIYASRVGKEIEIIGRQKIDSLCRSDLDFEIGNGSDGGWPMCGPMTKGLGYQAVHQWRSVNDRDAWLRDIRLGEQSHHEMLERLKTSS